MTGLLIRAALACVLACAMSTAQADDDPCPLEVQKNRLQKLFRQLFLGSDVLDFDDTGRVLREHGQCP